MKVFLKKKTKPEINVTPLIDVVFLLLVFFMLAAEFTLFNSLNITLPNETRSNTGISDKSLLVIEFLEKDILKINDIFTNKNGLIDTISKMNKYDYTLIITNNGTEVSSLINIIDDLKSLGINNFRIESKL